MMHLGKVALVGAGPGDIGLITVRGMELLRQADCIVYDRLLNKDFLEITDPKCEKIYVGKENHHHTLRQEEINELLFEKAGEYELVVRLKGGDPYVFGRGGEEARFLKNRGVPVEVIPGVTSSIAAAALAGIPVTHRGLSKGFLVITAHTEKDEINRIDYRILTDEDVTLVFLMGLSHVEDIAKGLVNAGRDIETPAAVISNGTTADQKKCVGNLGNIAKMVKEADLPSPSVILVGKVAALSGELDFFENRPLFGKKFFLPVIDKFRFEPGAGEKGHKQYGSSGYEVNELKSALTEKGAEVISVVAGRISPVEFDVAIIDNVKAQDFLIFTSSSGVKAFLYNLFEIFGKDIRALPKCKIAVVGDKTARTLACFGIRADYVAEKTTAADLARELARKYIVEEVDTDLTDVTEEASLKRDIYWFCGKRHSAGLEAEIPSGWSLRKVICYENIPKRPIVTEDERNKIFHCDGTILTCGSNARFACELIRDISGDPDQKSYSLPGEVYSIGPACTRILKEYQITGVRQAGISSYEGIIEMLV